MNKDTAKRAEAILGYIRDECLKSHGDMATWGHPLVAFGNDVHNAATVYFERTHVHFGEVDDTLDDWIESLYDVLFDDEYE